MTDDMEERLRGALRDHAGVPVAAGDPVVAVQDRMRRRSRRRGIAVGSTAALCVAGIAIAATALAGNDTSSRPIGPAVSSISPSVQSSPSLAPSPGGPVTSAEATAPVVSLPATPATPVATTTLPPNVSSLTLPGGYRFGALTTGSGPLLVTATIPLPSNDITPMCAVASIGGDPPAVDGIATSNCDDPVTAGKQVTMVVTEKTDTKSASGLSGTIAISHRNTKTQGFTVGPVIMKYTPVSDTAPVTAYGGGSLWIYDVDTNNGPEAIQISATTGQVQDVVRTPQLYRPIMAANGDGLWFGNSIEGGDPTAGSVFHVAPGSHAVSTVVASSSNAVDWLVADSGHVWAGIRPATATGILSLWRFDGPKGTVAFHTPEPTLQAGLNFVVGNEQDGLWLTTSDPPLGAYPTATESQHLDVIKLDADTGKPTVEAQLPPLDTIDAGSQAGQGQAAVFANDYFLLQSPSVGGYTGFTQLLRVTPLP